MHSASARDNDVTTKSTDSNEGKEKEFLQKQNGTAGVLRYVCYTYIHFARYRKEIYKDGTRLKHRKPVEKGSFSLFIAKFLVSSSYLTTSAPFEGSNAQCRDHGSRITCLSFLSSTSSVYMAGKLPEPFFFCQTESKMLMGTIVTDFVKITTIHARHIFFSIFFLFLSMDGIVYSVQLTMTRYWRK